MRVVRVFQGRLVTLNYGKSLPAAEREEGPYNVYGSNGVVGSHVESITNAPTVIVGRKGSIGEIHYSVKPCFPIDTTYFVDEFHGNDPHFLTYVFRELPFSEMNRATAVPGLNREDVYSLFVGLPPLAEQRRIVEKIDCLTALTTRARSNLDRIPVLVKRYKARFLAEAYYGKGSFSRANESIVFQKLEDLCNSLTDGDHQAPPRAAEGIPFITISAMNDGRINLDEATRYVPEEYYDGLKPTRRPEKGDILFSVTGTVGVPALVHETVPFVFQRHIAILKPDPEKVSSEYLFYILAAPQVMEQVLSVATGSAQLTVPLNGLRKFKIPVPSLVEQNNIVRHIETTFSWLTRVSVEHSAAAKLLPKLERSFLSKTLRGELIPQNPSDEPASTLLDRIKVEREATPKKLAQKRTKGKPMIQDPKERLLEDSTSWPDKGLAFEEVVKRNPITYDEIRDAIFALLAEKKPQLRQVFDTERECMLLQRVKS